MCVCVCMRAWVHACVSACAHACAKVSTFTRIKPMAVSVYKHILDIWNAFLWSDNFKNYSVYLYLDSNGSCMISLIIIPSVMNWNTANKLHQHVSHLKYFSDQEIQLIREPFCSSITSSSLSLSPFLAPHPSPAASIHTCYNLLQHLWVRIPG